MGNCFSVTITQIARKIFFSHSNHDVTEFDGVLPPDLMVEILHRLPSKPLIRFLSVSKSWRSAILSPDFIKKHQMYRQDKFISFLHRYIDIEKGVCLISKKTDDGDAIETNMSVPLPFPFNKVSLLGCSNGLVCIRFYETTFFQRSERTRFGLWNPATRQFKHLTSPKMKMYRPPDNYELFGSIDGFSYVSRIRDYNLVRILVFKSKRSAPNVRYLGRALVLNVAKKRWRELQNHELPYTRFDQHVVVANVCLHLLVFRPEGGQVSYHHASLLSFDLDEEKFRHTSVPYLCNHLNCGLNRRWRMLTVVNENLAMFVSPQFRADHDNIFELWVWDGLTWSWSKKFCFGRLPRGRYPFGFWSDGKIVVRKNYYNRPARVSASYEAYLYDPCDNKCSVIPFHERKQCSLVFFSYVESLVQI